MLPLPLCVTFPALMCRQTRTWRQETEPGDAAARGEERGQVNKSPPRDKILQNQYILIYLYSFIQYILIIIILQKLPVDRLAMQEEQKLSLGLCISAGKF